MLEPESAELHHRVQAILRQHGMASVLACLSESNPEDFQESSSNTLIWYAPDDVGCTLEIRAGIAVVSASVSEHSIMVSSSIDALGQPRRYDRRRFPAQDLEAALAYAIRRSSVVEKVVGRPVFSGMPARLAWPNRRDFHGVYIMEAVYRDVYRDTHLLDYAERSCTLIGESGREYHRVFFHESCGYRTVEDNHALRLLSARELERI